MSNDTDRARACLQVLAAVAMADGELDKRERRIIGEFVRAQGLGEADVKAALDKQSRVQRSNLPQSHEDRVQFMVELHVLAMADGGVSPSELQLIEKTAKTLKLSAKDIKSAREDAVAITEQRAGPRRRPGQMNLHKATCEKCGKVREMTAPRAHFVCSSCIGKRTKHPRSETPGRRPVGTFGAKGQSQTTRGVASTRSRLRSRIAAIALFFVIGLVIAFYAFIFRPNARALRLCDRLLSESTLLLDRGIDVDVAQQNISLISSGMTEWKIGDVWPAHRSGRVELKNRLADLKLRVGDRQALHRLTTIEVDRALSAKSFAAALTGVDNAILQSVDSDQILLALRGRVLSEYDEWAIQVTRETEDALDRALYAHARHLIDDALSRVPTEDTSLAALRDKVHATADVESALIDGDYSGALAMIDVRSSQYVLEQQTRAELRTWIEDEFLDAVARDVNAYLSTGDYGHSFTRLDTAASSDVGADLDMSHLRQLVLDEYQEWAGLITQEIKGALDQGLYAQARSLMDDALSRVLPVDSTLLTLGDLVYATIDVESALLDHDYARALAVIEVGAGQYVLEQQSRTDLKRRIEGTFMDEVVRNVSSHLTTGDYDQAIIQIDAAAESEVGLGLDMGHLRHFANRMEVQDFAEAESALQRLAADETALSHLNQILELGREANFTAQLQLAKAIEPIVNKTDRRRTGNPEIRGKVMIWDFTKKNIDEAFELLSDELRASPFDDEVTIFAIRKRWDVTVGHYNISGQPALQEHMEIAVVYWPSMECPGFAEVLGGRPPNPRPVSYNPGRGSSINIKKWIEGITGD